MKYCPICSRPYVDNSFSFCLDDGALLLVSNDSDETVTFSNADEATLIQKKEQNETTVKLSEIEIDNLNYRPANPFITSIDAEMYIDSCIWEKGLRNLSQSEYEQISKKLTDDFDFLLLNTVCLSLPKSQFDKISNMVKTSTPRHKVMEFIMENVPNVNQPISLVLKNFRNDYVQGRL